MASKDLHNNLQGAIALATQAITTDTTTVGATIDTQGFEGVEFTATVGTVTDGDYEFQLFEGDESNMSDEAEVTAAGSLLGAAPNWTDSANDELQSFGYRNDKRYLRLKVVSTNTTTGGTMGATVQLGDPLHAPTTPPAEAS